MQAWRIEGPVYAEQSHPETGTDGYVYYAEVSPDAAYTALYVTIYPEFWSLDEAARERWIAHELLHGPCSPLAEMAKRAVRRKQAIQKDVDETEERLVEHLTNIVWKMARG